MNNLSLLRVPPVSIATGQLNFSLNLEQDIQTITLPLFKTDQSGMVLQGCDVSTQKTETGGWYV